MTVTPTDDSLLEGDETIVVQGAAKSGIDDDRNNVDDKRTVRITHTAGGAGYDGITAEVAVTVTDDDDTPGFSVADACGNEDDPIAFTVTPRHPAGTQCSTEGHRAGAWLAFRQGITAIDGTLALLVSQGEPRVDAKNLSLE